MVEPIGKQVRRSKGHRQIVVQDVDGVLDDYLSMSFAAPHLFADRLDHFKAEVRQVLAA